MRPFAEAIRERDLQRYYQPWLDAQSLVNAADGRAKGLTYEGYEAKASRDKVLTAFAQLAALRLDVRRTMVSLIDSNRQYILAEATRTLSLLNHSAEHEADDLWLGHTILKRDDGICHHVFGSTYSAQEANGERYTANALVIPDCLQDPRFSFRDFVRSEPGVRFYAGVPITTKAGHTIGVYAVSDDKPRDGLKAAELRFLQDVATTVMEHLELAKDSDARVTGERMVRGLTEFIERSSLHESRSSPNRRPTTLEKQTENARMHVITDEGPSNAFPTAKQPPWKREPESDASRIFQRAARIMRESTQADGVVFFDTSTASISSQAYRASTPNVSSDESPGSSTTAGSATASRKRRRDKSGTLFASGTEGTEGNPDTVSPAESKPCAVVGLSLRAGSATVSETEFIFTEASMERYISRYPRGKFFSFDAEGTGINSSDEKSERSDPEHPEHSDKLTPLPIDTRRPRKAKQQFIPTEIMKILPNARNLIFLPLWDPASERWTAGGFIWTAVAGRLLNPDNELPYLKAFGNSITSELGRWNAQKSDRAKTTFIASISHELRSPLHGILGSVEFLRDTVSSGYQQSLVSSIETCGKTLLDTIDHVLDYAKINKLRSASARRKQLADGRSQRLLANNSILGVTTIFNLGQLVEEVCDTVCAGHTFRKTQDVHNVSLYDQGSRGEASIAGNRGLGAETGKDRVAVTLNVAPFVDWTVRTQPGAMRRVVMNLLGNALKYTDTGYITVSLFQHKRQSNSEAIDFELSVEDSGRGMSTEYQQTGLFAPFSQENPFSTGTGLGLSIVKQIIESLRGTVDVRSTLNVGTKVSVSLKLPTGALEKARTGSVLVGSSKSLRDKVASVVFPSASIGGAGEKLRESMALGCSSFNLRTIEAFDLTAKPDFLLTEPESLFDILAGHEANGQEQPLPAVICICTDPTEKAVTEGRIMRDFPSLHGIIEVMTQPCGPRKLAASLLEGQTRASQRIESLHAQLMHLSLPQDPTPGSNIILQRSTSDFVRGNNASSSSIPPSSFAAAHSPLVSAKMPTTSVPLASLAQSQIPDTPASDAPSEYFASRVLLVDDNAINLRLLVVFAQRQNLRFESALDGLQALNTFKKEAMASDTPARPFDFVLMDLQMPVMGGLESTRKIREFEMEHGLQKSTIVALTGLASEKDQQDAVDAGVDMYLVKPVKFADIKRIFGTR